MKNSIYILYLGVLVSLFRIRCEKFSETDLILVMAIINIAAFSYVLNSIIDNVQEEIKRRLKTSRFHEKTQKKYTDKIGKVCCALRWALFLAGGIFYVLKIRSAVGNDVLSIMALVLSITEEQVAKFLGQFIYNHI